MSESEREYEKLKQAAIESANLYLEQMSKLTYDDFMSVETYTPVLMLRGQAVDAELNLTNFRWDNLPFPKSQV